MKSNFNKDTINVLFIWNVRKKLQFYLQRGLSHASDVNLIFPQSTKKENLIKIASTADIMVGWRPTKKLILSSQRIKLFINPGAGVQHQIKRFREIQKQREVILVNGHGNSYFTAQHIVALLLSLTNKIVNHHQYMKNGKWRTGDKEAASIPLRNKTVGFFGYGKVNRKVHKFLSGFDLDFVICKNDPNKISTDKPHKKVYGFGGLTSFLQETDILIITAPLTTKTEGCISEKELRLLGKDALLINTGRGAIVDEVSLYRCLQKNIIRAAAIDVWYNYSPEPDTAGKKFPSSYPFYELENVILSPHRAASPFSDLKRWDEVIENITRFSVGNFDFKNIVNLDLEY